MPVKAIPTTSSDLDYREKVAAICELFSEGKSVAKMQEEMVSRFGRAGEINREKPYAMLRDAFKFGWLEYRAPDPGRQVVRKRPNPTLRSGKSCCRFQYCRPWRIVRRHAFHRLS